MTEIPDRPTVRKYGPRTDALEVLKDVDLTGKTILVTGTNSGIGRETARTLALRGARVVMFNRNIVESDKLRDEIVHEKPDAIVSTINMDLTSLQSVRAAANEFLRLGWPIHVLILNAGVFTPDLKQTVDGFDTTFGVNHLGHFYLTTLLLPKIRASAPARIVVVASHSHNHTFLSASSPVEELVKRLTPLTGSSEFGYRLYAYSKLCNVLFALKLHRDEHPHGVSTYVLHPGTMIVTNIQRAWGAVSRFYAALTRPFTKTLQQGAATTCYCAAHPEVEPLSGRYFESCWDDEKQLARALAHNTQLQDELWVHSQHLIDTFEQRNGITEEAATN